MPRQCSQCGRTYDDTFNFCLDDGTPLAIVDDSEATLVLASNDAPNESPRANATGLEKWQIAETMLAADPHIGPLMDAPVLVNFVKYLARHYPDENKSFLERTWNRYQTDRQETQKLLMQGFALNSNDKRRVFFKVKEFI